MPRLGPRTGPNRSIRSAGMRHQHQHESANASRFSSAAMVALKLSRRAVSVLTSAPARNTPTEIDRLLQDSPASFLESANGHLARANLKWSAMKDAPLEGLGWIHGFIPSSPLLVKRTVRRSRAQVKELKRAARAIYFQTVPLPPAPH
jgi:hypothetical protein